MSDIILKEDYEKLKKETEQKIKARNNAVAAIKDAKARYIKKKTKARSLKAAGEKDALLKQKRFDCLKDYDRREDIRDAYGWGIIPESECDRREAIWDEREELRTKSPDGIYEDLVTGLLDAAIDKTLEAFSEDIEIYEETDRAWKKQVKEAEEWHRQEHEKYKAWKNGWGEYAPKKEKEAE